MSCVGDRREGYFVSKSGELKKFAR
jgi:hypothetical protein